MTSQERWQSPIAPGISWYQATVGERPAYPALDGSKTVDVAIIGGLQKYVPSSMVMLAPYVNSYRRLTPDMSAPVNNAWGYDLSLIHI